MTKFGSDAIDTPHRIPFRLPVVNLALLVSEWGTYTSVFNYNLQLDCSGASDRALEWVDERFVINIAIRTTGHPIVRTLACGRIGLSTTNPCYIPFGNDV